MEEIVSSTNPHFSKRHRNLKMHIAYDTITMSTTRQSQTMIKESFHNITVDNYG